MYRLRAIGREAVGALLSGALVAVSILWPGSPFHPLFGDSPLALVVGWLAVVQVLLSLTDKFVEWRRGIVSVIVGASAVAAIVASVRWPADVGLDGTTAIVATGLYITTAAVGIISLIGHWGPARS